MTSTAIDLRPAKASAAPAVMRAAAAAYDRARRLKLIGFASIGGGAVALAGAAAGASVALLVARSLRRR